MSFAIRAENLGKSYQLGATHAGSVRELVNSAWNRLRRRSEPPADSGSAPADAGDRVQGNTFWALKDVSFEVKPGEVVGIIGRNGSGKSTLLKILSQITAPTTGRIELRGRVASLLEVGTGFHPELSGRENIYLNGAILGMTKSEITRKFDEIVAFAEIEKFIDTPVKRYSSGMYVRLAFAVAAHLEPEILVVDEVLAVGDAEFQRKCLGKMEDAARGGRTVLFVSHNMAVVSQICDRSVLLRHGGVELDGSSSDVTTYYLTSARKNSTGGKRDLKEAIRTGGDGKIRFTEVTLNNKNGDETAVFGIGEPILVNLKLTSEIANNSGVIGFSIRTLSDVTLLTSASDDEQPRFEVRPGDFQVHVTIDPNHLRPGAYWLQLGNTCGALRDLIPEAIQFTISDTQHYSNSCIHDLPGYFHFPFRWSKLSSLQDSIQNSALE